MANKSRVCWISGNRQEREKLLAQIKKSMGACEEFEFGADTPYAELEKQVLLTDCFGGNRLFILTGLPKPATTRATMMNNLKKLISGMPEDSLLVFYGIDPGEERAVYSHVAKEGKVFEFNLTVPLVDAEQMMQKYLADAGKECESNLLNKLVRQMPTNDGKTYPIDQVQLTADKLLSYMDKRKVVDGDDVVAISTARDFSSIWQLFDAIDDKNYDRCLIVMAKLCQFESEGQWTQGFCTRLFATAMWRFRIMLFLKDLMIKKVPQPEIVAKASELQKLTHEGQTFSMQVKAEGSAAYSPRLISTMLDGSFSGSPLEKYDRRRLADIVSFLQEAMQESRAVIVGGASYAFLGDLFLMVCCGKLDDKRKSNLMSFFHYETEAVNGSPNE